MPMTPDYPALVRRLMTAVETNDLEGYLNAFAPDAEYVIGNAAPLRGREAIRDAAVRVGQAVQSVAHEIHDVFDMGDGAVAVYSDILYRRRDGKSFRIPSLAIAQFDGVAIRRYQAFHDASAVFHVARSDRVMAMAGASSQGKWDEFESYLTDDVLFVVGSAEELRGPRQVSEFYRRTQEALKITGANMRGIWDLDDVVIMEMDVQAQPAGGGSAVVYPSVDTFRFRGDRVHEWRTYPLYSRFIKG